MTWEAMPIMNFFRKLWQDLKRGEMHAGTVAWEVLCIAFLLMVVLLAAGKQFIQYLLD